MKKLFIIISFSSEDMDIVFKRMEDRTHCQEFLGFLEKSGLTKKNV